MLDIRPMLVHADLSAFDQITIRFAERRPLHEVRAEDFIVVTDGGLEIPVRAVQPLFAREGRARSFNLQTATPVDFTRHHYRVVTSGAGEAPVRVGRLLADPTKFFDAEAVMGAVCTPQGTTFRLFAPAARAVRVVLADQPDGSATHTHELQRGDKGSWHLHLEGDWRGKFYSYRVSTPGGGTAGEVSDPAAICACGNRPRTLLVHLPDTDRPGFDRTWQPALAAYADAVIYEMNVRDFTIAANSGVTHRGRYLGLAESGTHLPEDPTIKTGLDHLVELGVTHVQLMPVQDFENDESFDGEYNWGYMPVHFNSPEGWYASDPVGDARIRELKQAVQAFHARGIAVCMDVVFNHTSGRASFERVAPGLLLPPHPRRPAFQRLRLRQRIRQRTADGPQADDRVLMLLGDAVRHRRFPLRSHGVACPADHAGSAQGPQTPQAGHHRLRRTLDGRADPAPPNDGQASRARARTCSLQ